MEFIFLAIGIALAGYFIGDGLKNFNNPTAKSVFQKWEESDVIEDVKKKYVRLALETGNHSSIARKAGISRDTFRRWMNEYKDEMLDLMENEGTTILSDNPTKGELLEKYEQAMKLLGEKELEVAMLKNLIKKNESL